VINEMLLLFIANVSTLPLPVMYCSWGDTCEEWSTDGLTLNLFETGQRNISLGQHVHTLREHRVKILYESALACARPSVSGSAQHLSRFLASFGSAQYGGFVP
jgi:hypothetical protein